MYWFLQEVKDIKIEIIFISADSSEEDMINYMIESHGSWLAVKYGDELAEKLNSEFGVRGIPMLVVMRKNENGDWNKVTTNGREIVQSNKDSPKTALEKFQSTGNWYF